MRIVRLEAENVKKLKAVRIEPSGAMVVIGGRNEQGKTSVLDSIEYALSGKASLPSEPIRRGQEKARIILDLGDLVVKRIFTLNGSRLEVSDKNGLHKSPQSILDSLVGRLSFDPLEFVRMNDGTAEGSKKQAEILKRLAGIDFDSLEQERESLFSERTSVNRELKAAQAKLSVIPDVEAPDKEVSIADMAKELERRMEANRQNQEKRAQLENLSISIEEKVAQQKAIHERIEKFREETKKRIVEMEAEIEKVRSDADGEMKKQVLLQKEVSGLSDFDIAEVKKNISEADAVNARVRQKKQRESVLKEVESTTAKSDSLTQQIQDIDGIKGAMLSEAKFPIEGLLVSDSGVTFRGIPFAQCSSAEQLKVSVAMGLAMNPKLKILLIRDGSLLDEDNLKLLSQMAEQAQAQIWLEKVGTGKEISILIEDGEIKS